MNYGSSRSSWKPWRWVGLTRYLRWGIYTSIPAWTHSRYSLAAAEALSLKIFPHEKSLKWWQRPSQLVSTRIFIRYEMTRGVLFWVCWKVNGNWDNNMIKFSQWKESHTSVRRKKEILKSRTVRVKVRNPSRKVNHLRKAIWEYNRVHQVYQFHQNRLASLYDGR